MVSLTFEIVTLQEKIVKEPTTQSFVKMDCLHFFYTSQAKCICKERKWPLFWILKFGIDGTPENTALLRAIF